MEIYVLKVLHPLIYEVALLEHCKQSGFDRKDPRVTHLFERGPLSLKFSWKRSLEGYQFWAYVSRGHIERAVRLIPQYS